MSTPGTETCRVWNRLFEEHEKLALKRMAHRNGRFKLMDPSKLERIHQRMERLQRQLRDHEQAHRCH